jgi:tRNA pseudouridine55 synthase
MLISSNSINSAEIKNIDFESGTIILIDKPLEWTSFDVVNKLRYAIKNHMGVKKIKVGHAGTLDPLATGLLILCTGKMTKQIDTIQAQIKKYSGLIALGGTTPTYDAEVEPTEYFPTEHIDDTMLEQARLSFIGEISQVPPIYSAIKMKGQKAYIQARKGMDVVMEPRNVNIHTFDIERMEHDKIAFEVVCSKGTYIRSLAHDFGKNCNSGAYLAKLRREGIGNYNVENAYTIDGFIETLQKNE